MIKVCALVSQTHGMSKTQVQHICNTTPSTTSHKLAQYHKIKPSANRPLEKLGTIALPRTNPEKNNQLDATIASSMQDDNLPLCSVLTITTFDFVHKHSDEETR